MAPWFLWLVLFLVRFIHSSRRYYYLFFNYLSYYLYVFPLSAENRKGMFPLSAEN